jgi:hypothetical protein
MFRQTLVSVWLVAVWLSTAAFAAPVEDLTIVPLTVEKGVPLRVQLKEKLRFEQDGSVHATVIEPVYAFDREVIPSGTELEGKITSFQKAGKWKRISRMLAGDFTPSREPQIVFHTLILPAGLRIPIEASAAQGSEKVVGSKDNHQASKGLMSSLVSTGKGSGKQRLQNLLWGLAPIHPQYLAAGTHLNAVLIEPLDFGAAVFRKDALDKFGSEIPANSVIAIRLITPIDSRTTPLGAPVDGLLTRPLFSPEHRLILPVGSVVRGHVTKVNRAHAPHHNGQLDFSFTSVEPPNLLPSVALHAQQVDGYVATIGVTHDMEDLRIGENGATRIVESRKRFIALAFAAVKADRALSASADSFPKAVLGAYRGKFLKEITGSDSGFGFPASISGAMIPHVAIGLGFYGAARSVYSNFLGPGRDIKLPENTAMEIHLEK